MTIFEVLLDISVNCIGYGMALGVVFVLIRHSFL